MYVLLNPSSETREGKIQGQYLVRADILEHIQIYETGDSRRETHLLETTEDQQELARFIEKKVGLFFSLVFEP